MFRRCRNCVTSQQAKTEASPSATKVPLERSPHQNPPLDAARSPPEPIKTSVATDFVGEADQHPSQVEDDMLKNESPIEREVVPMERVTDFGSPQQEGATAESRALQEAETEAILGAVAISPHSACEAAAPISCNALSAVSDAGNKLMLVSGVVVAHDVESALDQLRSPSEPSPTSSVPEAFDPVDGD
jgi:hypothetical protein